MTDRTYSLKELRIARGYNGEFSAHLSVESSWKDEIKVNLPEERVAALVGQLADLVTAALHSQFTNMRDDFIAWQEEKQRKLAPPIEAEANAE